MPARKMKWLVTHKLYSASSGRSRSCRLAGILEWLLARVKVLEDPVAVNVQMFETLHNIHVFGRHSLGLIPELDEGIRLCEHPCKWVTWSKLHDACWFFRGEGLISPSSLLVVH